MGWTIKVELLWTTAFYLSIPSLPETLVASKVDLFGIFFWRVPLGAVRRQPFVEKGIIWYPLDYFVVLTAMYTDYCRSLAIWGILYPSSFPSPFPLQPASILPPLSVPTVCLWTILLPANCSTEKLRPILLIRFLEDTVMLWNLHHLV